MSKQSAETRLALFNRMEGRGDILSIAVEDGAKLAALPKDMFADIYYPLFQWWIKGVDTSFDDPRNQMLFEGLKTHQLENAVKRGTSLKNWVANASKGGRPKKTQKHKKKPSGNQEDTKGIQLVDASSKTEDASSKSSVLDTSSSASRAIAHRDGLTPSDRNCTSPEDARQVLEEYAPPITSHTQCLSDKSTPKQPKLTQWANLYNIRNCHAASVMVAARIFPSDVSVDYEDINETKGVDRAGEYTDGFRFENYEHDDTDGEMFAAKLCEMADMFGDRQELIFKRALLDAAIYASQQEIQEKDAIVLGRLDMVKKAVHLLNGKPLPSEY